MSKKRRKFTIETFEADGTGEVKVIIRFVDKSTAENFIESVKASSENMKMVDKIELKDLPPNSFSPSFYSFSMSWSFVL